MLADPRRSCVILLNLTRLGGAGVAPDFATQRETSLSLLAGCQELFTVRQLAIGECEMALLPGQSVASIEHLEGEVLSFWEDLRLADRLSGADVGTIFLGGSYLEEDVLIAALQGAGRGYAIRILTDLSIARTEPDRILVFDRLAQHGVVATTVRQAVLEWAVSLGDAATIDKARRLLS